jgi:hypothetical protein
MTILSVTFERLAVDDRRVLGGVVRSYPGQARNQ